MKQIVSKYYFLKTIILQVKAEVKGEKNPIKRFFLFYYNLWNSISQNDDFEDRFTIVCYLFSLITNITLIFINAKFALIWYLVGLVSFLSMMYISEYEQEKNFFKFLKDFHTTREADTLGKEILFHILVLTVYTGGFYFTVFVYPYVIGFKIHEENVKMKKDKHYRRKKLINDLI